MTPEKYRSHRRQCIERIEKASEPAGVFWLLWKFSHLVGRDWRFYLTFPRY